jgi:hypothetical protein
MSRAHWLLRNFQNWTFIKNVILASQEAQIKRITFQSQLGQTVCETLSKKTHHQKGLVEWLKV